MEVWFYHLERRGREEALPVLLEKALARGWRAVVQAKSEELLDALDQRLWTYADDSFLAHGRASDGDPDLQPVYLTTGDENPNGARLRLFVEDAPILPSLGAGPYERAMLVFDGRDEAELAGARAQWRAVRDAGLPASYWAQDAAGRWEKKA
ncbi:DNA polymerase III subunit chi [Methylocella sp.]|uniref:DNA polymerase III subunit chi n=1 Tax=Methylocella sp. TaxID=1978226 RepID=UPI003782F019